MKRRVNAAVTGAVVGVASWISRVSSLGAAMQAQATSPPPEMVGLPRRRPTAAPSLLPTSTVVATPATRSASATPLGRLVSTVARSPT